MTVAATVPARIRFWPLTRLRSWVSLDSSRARVRGRPIAYGIPSIVVSLGCMSWFRAGTFIASGDVSPFLRDGLASEFTSLWNHRESGAGATSAEIVRLPEVVLSVAVRIAGGTPVLAQQLFYVLVVLLAAWGATYLARALGARPVAAAVAGVLAVFNPLVLVNLPNPLTLIAVGTTGLLAGSVMRAARGHRVSGRRTALLSLPASYLGVNPPTLLTVAAIVALSAVAARWLVGVGSTRRAVRHLVFAAPWLVLVNLWWLVPLIQAIVRPVGLAFAAQTDVTSWSWSHADNTVANTVTLKAQWGWSHPEYYPYAKALDGWPWAALRWALPICAAVAPIVNAAFRRCAVTLVVFAAACVFVGKGLHSPGSGANEWLYRHVPLFWLFREPMSKVGPGLVLAYVVLAAITLDGFAQRVRDRPSLTSRGGLSVAIVAVVAAAAFPFPLWTGAAIADSRLPLPGAHVAVPPAWNRLADVINSQPSTGKVLVLPLDPFYQMTTTWGYHGVDDIVRQLVTRPVIQRLPGGYFGETPGFDSLLTEAQSAVLRGDSAQTLRLLQTLGVSHVVVRDDLIAGPGSLPFADSTALGQSLENMPGIVTVATEPVARVFATTSLAGEMIRTYADTVAVQQASLNASARVISELPADQVASPPNFPATRISVALDNQRTPALIRLAASGRYQLVLDRPPRTLYRVEIVRDSPGASSLRISDPETVSIDGREISSPRVTQIPLPTAEIAAIGDGTDNHLLTAGSAIVPLTAGATITAYQQSPRSLLERTAPAVSDCNASDHRNPAQAGIQAATLPGAVTQLVATAHSACVIYDAPLTRGLLRLSVSSRTLSGRPARICVWQTGPDQCAKINSPPGGAEWQRTDEAFALDPGTTAMRVYLYADGPDDGTQTITEYRDLQLTTLNAVAATSFKPESRQQVDIDLSADAHLLSVQGAAPTQLAGAPSTVEDCAAASQPTAHTASRILDDGSVQLRASADSACTWLPINTPGTSLDYHIRLHYRTIDGLPARICLWESGPNKCADLPPLQPGATWTTYDATAHPDPDTRALRLYLYADGRQPQTITEYSDISVTVQDQHFVTAQRSDTPASAAPTVTWSRDTPARYHADTAPTSDPFVIVLNESFAPGWRIDGLPATASVEHFQADGYANGWRITPATPTALHLRFTYQPQKLPDHASLISATALPAALFAGRLKPRRRCRHRRRSPRNPATNLSLLNEGAGSGKPVVRPQKPVDTEPEGHAMKRSLADLKLMHRNRLWLTATINPRDKFAYYPHLVAAYLAMPTGKRSVIYLGHRFEFDNAATPLNLQTYPHEIGREILCHMNDRPRIVLDIGGNIGQFSTTLAYFTDLTQLDIFEPNRNILGLLSANVAHLGTKKRIFNYAVGAGRDGYGEMYYQPGRSAIGSIIPANAGEKTHLTPTPVQFCGDPSLLTQTNTYDLVKIDVEGFEIEVIQALSHIKTAYLFLEVSARTRQRNYNESRLFAAITRSLGEYEIRYSDGYDGKNSSYQLLLHFPRRVGLSDAPLSSGALNAC
jgi:arabinofuranan 3-O-arabinosyltransferase